MIPALAEVAKNIKSAAAETSKKQMGNKVFLRKAKFVHINNRCLLKEQGALFKNQL